jgi:hypothetical protein
MRALLSPRRQSLFELRHGHAAIEKHKGSVIFKLAVGGPLHADELRREDGEARMA